MCARRVGSPGRLREDGLAMQKPAPDDAIVMRPPEKKAA